jgi:hypothetical protein
MTKEKKNNEEKGAQGSLSKIIKTRFSRFIEEYGAKKNVYKVAGIVSAIGLAGFLAFKFIPWNRVTDKFEKSFKEAFGEDKFDFNLADTEVSI